MTPSQIFKIRCNREKSILPDYDIIIIFLIIIKHYYYYYYYQIMVPALYHNYNTKIHKHTHAFTDP